LSPFSATIVQNSSILRNDRHFATYDCVFKLDTPDAWYSRTAPPEGYKMHLFSPGFFLEAAT
jgi:hypothetical protein